MQKLLIATTNPAKLGEYRLHLKELPLELVSLADLGLSSVEETGKTFEENALIKARHYFKKSGLPTVADDGGLEVDALNGEPGVRSHRWIGNRDNTDEELVSAVLERMKDVIPEERTARMRTIIAFIAPDGAEHITEGITEGVIADTAGPYEPGFPYRGLLYVPRYEKLFSQLTPEEHEEANQRVKALTMLKPLIAQALCE